MLSRIIPIILDENVDSAVGSFLEERGHRVQRVRESFAAMTKDEVIAVLGNENRAVIGDTRQRLENACTAHARG